MQSKSTTMIFSSLSSRSWLVLIIVAIASLFDCLDPALGSSSRLDLTSTTKDDAILLTSRRNITNYCPLLRNYSIHVFELHAYHAATSEGLTPFMQQVVEFRGCTLFRANILLKVVQNGRPDLGVVIPAMVLFDDFTLLDNGGIRIGGSIEADQLGPEALKNEKQGLLANVHVFLHRTTFE